MPRGGRRAGAPGKAYSNRSDLSVNKGPQPVGNFAGPSVPYGTGAALSAAQQAVPVSSPQPPGPSQAPPDPMQALQGAQGPPPGSLGTFHGPTERPSEPITHGLPSGPGGGPEVLASPSRRPGLTLLQQVAGQPFASDEIKGLLNKLMSQGG